MLMSALMKRVMAMLACVSLVSSYSTATWAGVVSTGQMLQQQAGIDRTSLISVLERDEVRQRLIELGVDPEQAKLRIAALDDEQIEEIQANLDGLPAAAGVLEVVVAVLVVLVILDLVGVTNIFPFIHS
jgi:hypothetical protein